MKKILIIFIFVFLGTNIIKFGADEIGINNQDVSSIEVTNYDQSLGTESGYSEITEVKVDNQYVPTEYSYSGTDPYEMVIDIKE